MRINELKIDGFGKHCNLNINFRENINIILGRNESGKSTVVSFIRALLYGMPEIELCNDRKKYHPWDKNAKYGGEMIFEHNNILYKVSAEFGNMKKNDVFTLYNVTANENIAIKEGKTVGEIVLGISSDTYDLSSYASQLASKPDLENANFDYLFDHLMKKSEESKNSSADIMSGKRILAAMEAINAQKTGKGIIDNLQQRKLVTEEAIKKIVAAKTEAEQKHNEYNALQQELNEEKDKHIALKTDISDVTHAIEVVSLHNDVKNFVKDINVLDENLAEAANKSKRIRTPVNIIYISLMALLVVFGVLIFFSPQLNKFSFLQGVCKYLNVFAEQKLSYVILGTGALLLTVLRVVFFYVCNKNVRAFREELFIAEENLCELLNIEYIYGVKNHSKNRENINLSLEKHQSEYKRARSVLENEENKNKTYSEHLITVEEYTEKIAYAKASADALNKAVSEMEDTYLLEEELAEIKNNISIFERRYEALTLASEIMEEAYQRWQSESGPSFGKEAGEILSKLTDGHYNEVKVSRNFDLSIKNGDGVLRRAYSYSGATIDQMYLALRLSLVKALSTADGILPVVLDDPFVQYDDERKKFAYNTLENFSKENNMQVIMTTCTKEPFYETAQIISL
ncbi:MAG: hypothetical protein E7387_08435 [Ruminococcaceae bacterium]|nr:hypothetical protein [Oscillospiraceae bacterium]